MGEGRVIHRLEGSGRSRSEDARTLVASQLFIHFVDQNGAMVSREREEAVLVEGLGEELLS